MAAAHRIDVHHHPSPPSYIHSRNNSNRFATPQLQWTVASIPEAINRGCILDPFPTGPLPNM